MDSVQTVLLKKLWILIFLIVPVILVVNSQLLSNLVHAGAKALGKNAMMLPIRLNCETTGDEFEIKFYLYTKEFPNDPVYLLKLGDTKALDDSSFEASRPTKMIIHGFYDNMKITSWMKEMKNSFMNEGNYNVILVDWSCGNGYPYSSALRHGNITAHKTRDLIKFIMSEKGATPQSFHVIGHSLGGHISGKIGQLVPNLGRITALDPSGPGFYKAGVDQRLDSTDALFVDVIHTNSADNLLEGFGYYPPLGHLDFYANGGTNQPGCIDKQVSDVLKLDLIKAVYDALSCDHFRAIYLFIHSIIPSDACTPIGVVCKNFEIFEAGLCANCSIPGNCAIMGYHSDKYIDIENLVGDKNKYYLKTADNVPYCLSQMQVVIETNCSTCLQNNPGFHSGKIELHLQVKVPVVFNISFSLTVRILHTLTLNRTDAITHYDYVYTLLATSTEPMGTVEKAVAKWSDTSKTTPPKKGISFSKIKIYPIAMVDQSSHSVQEIVLCGPAGVVSDHQQLINLGINTC